MFKILIVDDSKSVHAFVKSLFASHREIEVASVLNGREAVELITQGQYFDLILLDWEMPELSGPETLKKLSSIGSLIPVLMMTTRNNPEDIRSTIELGVAEYMMKPFTSDILFEKIEAVTGKALKNVA